MAAVATSTTLDETDAVRAQLYGLLAGLLAKPPDEGLLALLRGLPGNATPLGRAFGELAASAATTAERATREYEALFIGVVRGDVVPYASYYLTGFLNERPLARLRADLAALGIERSPEVVEPEDHLASLCEVMAGLIAGRFGEPAGQARIFRRHLQPWAGRCFGDIEQAPSACLYRPVGTIGRLFLALENDVFGSQQEQREETHHERDQSP